MKEPVKNFIVNSNVPNPLSSQPNANGASGGPVTFSMGEGYGGATANKGGGGSDHNASGQRPDNISQDPGYKWSPGHSA